MTNKQQTIVKAFNFHKAIDRRCYDGAYCSDLQREIDSKQSAKDFLRKHNIRITYFPAPPTFYVGFLIRENKAPEIITPDCDEFEQCANLCLKYLSSN